MGAIGDYFGAAADERIDALSAAITAEADAAHERSRALDPPRILSGFDWFEWGLRRAAAIIEGTDRYDLASLPMDPSEAVDG